MSVLAKIVRIYEVIGTSRYNEVRILIDGAYGGSINTKPYAGVAMMATGAGIAAQLPYVNEFLEFQQTTKGTGEKGEHDTRQQRISLIRQLDEECKLFSIFKCRINAYIWVFIHSSYSYCLNADRKMAKFCHGEPTK